MKKNFTKFALIGLAVATVLAFGACSKYKGFKKADSGIYYKFYGDIHDTASQPKTGDLVGVLVTLRVGDSILKISNEEMLMDSIYEGDLFEAIRMMHVGDSATFIFDGHQFFEKNVYPPQEYEFGDEPLYVDMLLYAMLEKSEFERLSAELEAQMEEFKEGELEDIENYLKENPGFKEQPSGVYLKTIKKGKGEKVTPPQKVKVHYTGRLLDGTIFDSSEKRGEPLEFMVGIDNFIPGWTAAVSTMSVGDKVTVLIPSELAYGEGGNGMPPYTPLLFDIELLEIVK